MGLSVCHLRPLQLQIKIFICVLNSVNFFSFNVVPLWWQSERPASSLLFRSKKAGAKLSKSAPPSTPDFSGGVGSNLALCLVPSGCSRQTA